MIIASTITAAAPAPTPTLKPLFTCADRSPIARLMISSSGHLSAANPAGFLFDLYDADLHRGMEKYVAHSISVMNAMGARRMIVWDLAGGATPQYIGQCDLATVINPGMNKLYADFFRGYRAVNFDVGLLISPTEYDPATGAWIDAPDPLAALVRQGRFAKKTYGCTLFYIDAPYYDARANPSTTRILPAAYLARLRKALPGCQLITEAATVTDYLYAFRYLDLKNGPVEVDALVLESIPNASAAICIQNGDVDGNFEALVASARRGNLLMADGWQESDRTKAVSAIMEAARAEQ